MLITWLKLHLVLGGHTHWNFCVLSWGMCVNGLKMITKCSYNGQNGQKLVNQGWRKQICPRTKQPL